MVVLSLTESVGTTGEEEKVFTHATVWSVVKSTTELPVGICVAHVPKSLLKAVPLASLVGCQLESERRTCEAVNTFFFAVAHVISAATSMSPIAGTVPE